MNSYISKPLLRIAMLLMITGTFMGCNEEKKTIKVKEKNKPLFIGKIFEEQILLLQKSNKNLHKKGNFERKFSDEVLPSKNINWERELKFFKNIDLSKPAWDGYLQIDTIKDSNKIIVHIKALKADIPYKNIHLVYEDNLLKQLSGVIDISNDYMINKTNFKAFFKDTLSENYLERYEVNGSQFFKNQEEVNYHIEGILR